ncbi:type II secretion system protein GspG [Amycolatopsis sp. NPDC101161]|uniref:type II secretion system protein GspG n=1 Tax=Amycolatopsis sp. NPDC101161 TaxID=3363940 RepID=UPI00380E5ACA
MDEITNSSRTVLKATYSRIMTPSGSAAERAEPTAFDKLAFARDLELSSGEASSLTAAGLPDGAVRLAGAAAGEPASAPAAAALAGRTPADDLVAVARAVQDLRADPGLAVLIDRFDERRQVEPVAWLHLERIEMAPAGLERGELVATIPMAPHEKVTVSHKEWSTHSTEFENIVTDSFESYSEEGVAEKHDVAMSSESENQRDSATNFGVTATGSYGPVSLTTSLNLSSAQSERDTRTTSTKDALEKTRKSSARARKEHKVSLRVETRGGTEDIAARQLENPSNQPVRIDYYRMMRKWRVDLIRYGLRMTYDLVVPDPGANLRKPVLDLAAVEQRLSGVFGFDDVPVTGLTRENWARYAAKYGVTVDPPPPARLLQPDLTYEFPAFIDEGEAIKRRFQSWQFDLKEGYVFRPELFEVNYYGWQPAELAQFDVVGDESGVVSGVPEGPEIKGHYSSKLAHLDGKAGHISIQYVHRNISWAGFRLAYHLDLTDDAFANWQAATWAKLRDAAEQQYYATQQALRDTRERLQAAIDRDDTLTLRRAEREEVMKRTLQWLFGPAFDVTPNDIERVLDAVLDSSSLSPMSADDWGKVREFGEFVKFLHQAVEWENVLYFLYPYFWGSQALGDLKQFLWHPDPTRRDFLRAGAARVALPIRPGFEVDFATLMETGSLPQPGTAPRPPYVTLAQEMQFFSRTNYAGIPPANPDVRARTRPLVSERQQKAWEDLQVVIRALEAFAEAAKRRKFPDWTGAPAEPEYYPTTAQGLAVLPGPLPLKDPWNKPYLYESPGRTAPFLLRSLGADGQPGGEGDNAEISTEAEGNLVASWFEYTPSSGLDIALGDPAD